MKYKKTLLVTLTVIFASCGGGGGSAIGNLYSSVTGATSSFLMIPAVY